MGVEKTKGVLKLDKHIFLGMSILDLSKIHMYSFYYDVLKKKYGDNVKLIYTDTTVLFYKPSLRTSSKTSRV